MILKKNSFFLVTFVSIFINFYYKNIFLQLYYNYNINILFYKAKIYYCFFQKHNYKKNLFFNSFINQIKTKLKFYCIKLNIIGLGYKYFVYNSMLYLLIGFSHFLIYKIPSNIKLICRKKKLFIISVVKQELFLFSNMLKKSRKLNIYKGKGLIEFKQFKNYIKLKKGKKQQFM